MADPESRPPSWPPSLGFGNVGVVWTLAALSAAVVVALAIVHLRNWPGGLDGPQTRPGPGRPAVVPASARQTLGDADRLAARGLHLEAVRALLDCGLGTIADLRPGVLRPTATSRDIAGDAALPEPVRLGFGRIARTVEVGLFGGRPVDVDDYAACRSAFVDAALGGGG